jgi:hypothetical protein
MSIAGNQENRPGSDGADAVTGDFTFLVFLIVLFTLLVRAVIRRGRKHHGHTGPGPGGSRADQPATTAGWALPTTHHHDQGEQSWPETPKSRSSAI